MEGWTRRIPADWPELKASPKPVIAQYVNGFGQALTLYEDGTIEFEGIAPVELLPYIAGEWTIFLRGKIA
jgi:hypothetical protein